MRSKNVASFEVVWQEFEVWRGGRVVECARLEIGCAERYRGFESLPLRHNIKKRFWFDRKC